MADDSTVEHRAPHRSSLRFVRRTQTNTHSGHQLPLLISFLHLQITTPISRCGSRSRTSSVFALVNATPSSSLPALATLPALLLVAFPSIKSAPPSCRAPPTKNFEKQQVVNRSHLAYGEPNGRYSSRALRKTSGARSDNMCLHNHICKQ